MCCLSCIDNAFAIKSDFNIYCQTLYSLDLKSILCLQIQLIQVFRAQLFLWSKHEEMEEFRLHHILESFAFYAKVFIWLFAEFLHVIRRGNIQKWEAGVGPFVCIKEQSVQENKDKLTFQIVLYHQSWLFKLKWKDFLFNKENVFLALSFLFSGRTNQKCRCIIFSLYVTKLLSEKTNAPPFCFIEPTDTFSNNSV